MPVRASVTLLSMTLAPVKARNLDTSNASVNVKVGQAFRGRVTLTTNNGSLHIGGQSPGMKTESTAKGHARLVFGEGGADSRVNTSNGGIQFDLAE
jgi:hypothetical protein